MERTGARQILLDSLKPKLGAAPVAAPGRIMGDHAVAGLTPSPAFLQAARPAAVLVGIIARADGPSLILTERAAHLRRHAGQVAFPGGRREAGEGVLEAALREAHEEIDLEARFVEPLGYLDPYFSGTGYRVDPVVALIDPAATLRPDAGEVARVFELPLAVAFDLARYRLDGHVIAGAFRRYYVIDFPDAHIWGVTAGILRLLAERVLHGDDAGGRE